MNKPILALSYIILLVTFTQAFAANAPDPPTSPSATAVSPTQVNIFWNPPVSDGGSGITGYKIEYKTGTGSYSVLVANTGTSGTTYYSHTGLTTNTQYMYRISAINGVGTGNPSSEVSATPTASSTGSLPDAPTNLTGVAASPTQANLAWTKPASTGGYPISGYKIEYRVGSGIYATLIENTGSTSTTYTHSGLSTGQIYVYRVYSVTAYGTGTTPSNEALVQPTTSSHLAAPGAPTGLAASASSPTQVNLSWVAPSNNGGSQITGYKIEAKSGSGSYFNLDSNTGSTTTYAHTGLNTGTTYTYRVSAINSIGTGSPSTEASATPTSSSSAGVPTAPTGLTAISSGTQINLSWAAPANTGGYSLSGYKIEYRIGSGSYSNLVSNTGTTSTTYSHTGLASGQLYVYRVSAINPVGTGPASSEASATAGSSSSAGVPGSVIGLVATAASPTQVNLSWSPPSNNGGTAVTGYKIEVKKASGSYETLITNSQSTMTSFSHTGLTSGTTYYYRVSAVNSVGAGPQSEVSATPKDTDRPTVTATATNPNTIVLTWVPPSQTYKQTITGYKVEQKLSAESYTVLQENIGTGTTFTISNLETGKTYTYAVSAHFSLGDSPRSADVTATPLSTSNASPPSQSTGTTADPPTNVIATPYSPTQINLSWTAPPRTNVIGYKIDVKAGPAPFETLVSSTMNSTTKYSHTHVTTGTAYTYHVYTITSTGISLASNDASATATTSTIPPAQPITARPPSPPTLYASVVSPTQINLSWSTPSNNGGASILGYRIDYKIGTGVYHTLTNKAIANTFSHTGLLSNTYSYRVYAINSAGTSLASNEISLQTAEQKPPEQTPDTKPTCGTGTVYDSKSGTCVVASSCGTGTVFDDTTKSCIVAPTQISDQVDKEPKTTQIPGFPDPTKDPQTYITRYNTEPAYKAWFDRNFPGKTIYAVVGVPEPEPAEPKCDKGTHYESGLCVADKAGLFGGGCLIATASYGTELAPQVQSLREIRENVLSQSGTGVALLSGFNEFYYSFSPTVSDWERQSPIFRELVKATITPMISTLSILNYANIHSESELLGYGMSVILLNAGLYIVTPAFAIVLIRNKIKSGFHKQSLN